MGKADLHLHTSISDGLASVDSLLEYVQNHTDLDVIAVTDHEDVRGGLRARELAARRGYRFEVVVGSEVTTLQGHLLALFIEQDPRLYRSVETTLEDVHAQGGLAVIPHPSSWLTRSLSLRTIDRIQRRAEPGVTFDAVETHNPSLAGIVTRRRALERNRRWRLVATGSSDAHHLSQVARGWTAFEGASAEELRVALVSGNVLPQMVRYPSLREVGYGRIVLGLAWGYTATPRKAWSRAKDAVRRRR